ncbi:hypothetical protein B0P06_006037 [Clostridium saccharoperbutylacetonicum]|uniref:Uncharacterized protein n=1 Tax=Clostridium saccharoperbutylacetonicum N1-4(HMT) TaxID=931276 RepID=M1MYI0_9CLOT|nr:hypothetical protein [Clostridium saccharoperbutylacetonicum]AGF59581.1 hypothetical protein Cspa_135p00210 [Clostridium saccharoperbutylacetonicum N1-4(HMT)]NRT64562.1 hypothetical protein [Clostridium saccharoperbutylacetonicum]NSB29038.1 hypothetical protein [Clostridium saccharoperbutylacetonicum]NSB46144.1 hypothetical protein [Clostridium saccharoperbutylacetonicum]
MSGFNVETYEIFRKKNSIANEGNYDNLSNRVAVLENNLMSINSTFTYDFDNDDYIDLYKSTVTMTSNGIIPKQYLNKTFINFNEDDDYVDYDNSTHINWDQIKKEIAIDDDSTLTGTLMLKEINVNSAVGMKFDCDYKNKDTISALLPQDLINGNLWFVSEVDNYGRLWVLSCQQFDYGTANNINFVIYNKDMSVYKSYTLPNKALFNDNDTAAQYPVFNSARIKFTDENVAVVVTRTIPTFKDGGHVEQNSNATFTDYVTLLNEIGNYNKLGSYSGYYIYNASQYIHVLCGSTPAEIELGKDFIFVMPGSYKCYMSDNASYLNYRNRNFIGYEITGSLTDLTNVRLIKNAFKNSFPRITGWEPGGSRYTVFRNSNVVYVNDFFHTFGASKELMGSPSCTDANISNSINQIYSLQCGINTETKSFSCETLATDMNFVPLSCTSNDVVTYSHNGFNGIYYASNGRLYIFGNSPLNSKDGLLNCYTVDWSSRKKGSLVVNNVFSKKVQLETCSFAESEFNVYDNLPNSNSSTFMKIIEHKNKLHLFFMAPQSDTIRRLCLKYMSFDYDLTLIAEETIIYAQESDSKKLQDFNVSIFNDELLVLYSVGDRTDPRENNQYSQLYAVKIGYVTSTVKFYYLDDAKRVWTNINSGDEVKFVSPVSEVYMKAVLESDTYDCSPTINNITIQTWNNNNGVSRQSEYYSKRIEEVQDDGKGVLSADYEANDGVIDWFVSYDGGQIYNKINLNEEFVFTHLDAPDFRVKAVMSVTDNAKKLPIIHSYTLKTNSLVLHSDLEEIQINLIKTNFKIDTYTRASKNGLMKMTIDTLSDENFIDQKNSKYTFYNSYGYAGGNYLQTKPEEVNEKVRSILLSVDEICENPNSKIIYYASADGGLNFKEIKPNVKTQLTNVNTEKDQIVMKAVFYEGAKLNAWGWAWD